MFSFGGTSVVDAQTKGIVVDGVKGRSLSDVNIYLQKDSVEVYIIRITASWI